MRADPKMVTLRSRRNGRNTRNASAISARAESATFRSITSVPSAAMPATVSSIDRKIRRWAAEASEVSLALAMTLSSRPAWMAKACWTPSMDIASSSSRFSLWM